ncbi:MAG: flippase-like domain-containing protein [Chloroflexi bacterium]|nr:flippase-like domain-containing protein [Chloroflexota bacterium]
MRKLGRWFGFLVSIGIVALLLHKVGNLHAVFVALTHVDYRWVVVGALLYLASFIPRALRWQRLLRGVGHVRLRPLGESLAIGFMANNALPLRLGELVRAYIIGRKERVPATAAFATIVVERVCDGFTLVCALAVVSLYYPFPGWIKRLGMLVAFFFCCVLLVLALFVYQRPLTERFFRTLVRFLPSRFGKRLQRLREEVDQGLHLLRSPGDALIVVFLSLIVWTLELLVYTRVLAAFAQQITAQLGHAVPIHDILLLLIVINFGIMIPSAPGYIGPFQAAAIAVLAGIAGLSQPVAFSISWVLWATLVLPIVVIGFALLSVEQISLGKLTLQVQDETAGTADALPSSTKPQPPPAH